MAEESFLIGLVKKALVSAASAAGSKIGGVAASYVLDLIGLGNNELDEIKDTLNTISQQVKKTDSKISVLMDEIKWQHATDSFDNICAAITTHNDNIQTLLTIQDATIRDAKLKQYILNAHPPIDELDTSLTLIDNRLMGKSAGITGTYDAPLMQTYIETHWSAVWNKNADKTYQNILAVYLQSVQMQRLATTLLVAYREASDQSQLAQAARDHIETRLAAQFQVMAKALPDFIALNAFTAPGLQLELTGFQVAPTYVMMKDLQLKADKANNLVWGLNRIGADPATATYTLTFGTVYQTTERVDDVITSIITTGDPSDMPITMHATVHLLAMVMPPYPIFVPPLRFSIEVTEQMNALCFRLADGRTLGYIDRSLAGHLIELTSTAATTTNGYVLYDKFTKTPYRYQPTLSAWSRAFSNTPQGEGRFTPGYRVRYRVIHINRFGESDKSDWVLAPKSEDSQDSDGYFGNHAYYFPQIALVNPTGLTEAYRVFRQFKGGAEEEVTAGGTFTGDPQSGNPVIFDDFTP